jgi:hypothetical protein
VLGEIGSQESWSNLFAESQNLLEHLAGEAIRDLEVGRTQPLDGLQ